MSSLVFSLIVSQELDTAHSILSELSRDFSDLPSSKALLKVNSRLCINESYLPRIDLTIQKDDELSASVEAGSAVPLVLFEAIVQKLEQIPGIRFKAKLFDSSSGGVAIWGTHVDADLEDKNVLFLGVAEDELDEMQELMEVYGQLHTELQDDTEVIIAGLKADKTLLEQCRAKGMEIITEEDFWEFIGNQTG